MTAAPSHPRVDLTGPPLVLHPEPGPHVQVLLVDLDGVAPEDGAAHLGVAAAGHPGPVGVVGGDPETQQAALAAGAGLVIVDLTATGPDAVERAVRTGAVVVLHGTDPADAVAACDRLHAGGVDTARVVVEVGPDADVVAHATTLERAAFSFRVGVDLGAAPGEPLLHHAPGLRAPAPDEPRPDDPRPDDPRPDDPDDPGDAATDTGGADRHAGWEIGALTALLGLPVATVRGVAPARVARVRAVLHALDAAAAGEGWR